MLSKQPAPMTLLTKGECLQFHSLYEFLNGKGSPCNGQSKIRHVKFTEGSPTRFPAFDEASFSKTPEPDEPAEVFIIEKVDTHTIELLLKNRISPENRPSFLKFLDAYLHDQPSFNYGDVRHQIAPMPSVVTKQQHVAFTYVTAREFDRNFHLGYREIQRAGKDAGSWRIERTWGPMNPVQRVDTDGVQSTFSPLAISRTQAAAWFHKNTKNCWNFGIILLDEPPKFSGLPALLKPSYHIIGGDWYANHNSSSDLLVECMKQNTNLQTTTVPSPLVVVQDLYRLISFEWALLISYYTRDLNSIEWALQHGRGDHKVSPEVLKESMRNLFLSRRRIPWYRSIIRDQLSSCQPKGRRFWSLAGPTYSPTDTIAEGLVDDFQHLEYLMTQLHDRLDASMAHIAGETNVLEAQRTHELNQMTFQQNRIAFAQNKILLALALVGTFFLPINAIAAVFSMGGKWAAGENSFPVFWAICIPTSLGLVSALLVFMHYGNRRPDRVNGKGLHDMMRF